MHSVQLALEKAIGEPVESQVPLAPHTYMKVGGVAKFFYVARSTSQLITAVRAASQQRVPWQILGNASNVLVSDRGIDGLVIQNRSSELSFVTGTSDALVASGVPLSRLIVEAANRDLAGLEPLFGIPATVGGGVYGNIGAHGTEISQFVRELTLYQPVEDRLIKVSTDWLRPTYRSTRIKEERRSGTSTTVIVTVKFTLMRRRRDAILQKIREYDQWRRIHQPIGSANCGSVFRNPGTLPGEHAGFLLEQAGVKAVAKNGAHVSQQHANFVINDGGASAEDVRSVISQMRSHVAQASGVELYEEIEYLGSWDPQPESIRTIGGSDE